MSELLPHTAKIVDEIAVIKTVNTSAINHDPATVDRLQRIQAPQKGRLARPRSTDQADNRPIEDARRLGRQAIESVPLVPLQPIPA